MYRVVVGVVKGSVVVTSLWGTLIEVSDVSILFTKGSTAIEMKRKAVSLGPQMSKNLVIGFPRAEKLTLGYSPTGEYVWDTQDDEPDSKQMHLDECDCHAFALAFYDEINTMPFSQETKKKIQDVIFEWLYFYARSLGGEDLEFRLEDLDEVFNVAKNDIVVGGMVDFVPKNFYWNIEGVEKEFQAHTEIITESKMDDGGTYRRLDGYPAKGGIVPEELTGDQLYQAMKAMSQFLGSRERKKMLKRTFNRFKESFAAVKRKSERDILDEVIG